jgi:hypothetical protein
MINNMIKEEVLEERVVTVSVILDVPRHLCIRNYRAKVKVEQLVIFRGRTNYMQGWGLRGRKEIYIYYISAFGVEYFLPNSFVRTRTVLS